MTETAVHVTTVEEWKSVLDVWFEQGYQWSFGKIEYFSFAFNNGARFLFLSDNKTDNKIYQGHESYGLEFIEYAEFMAQQKEDNQMDPIYKPSHYQLEDGTQVKDHITSLTAHMSGVRAWATGNAIKYLARAGRKDDMVKDLKKAQENIQIIIDDIEKENN